MKKNKKRKMKLNKRGKIQLAIFIYILYIVGLVILAKTGLFEKMLDYIFIIY